MRRQANMDRNLFMGEDVYGKSIGIIGIGNVGSRIAELARGLSMRVLAYDPYLAATDRGARRRKSSSTAAAPGPISSPSTAPSPRRRAA